MTPPHLFSQHADPSAVSADEFAAVMTIPASFCEHPGSRPLILRLEVGLWCCFNFIFALTFLTIFSEAILDAKVHNQQRFQANTLHCRHSLHHFIAACLSVCSVIAHYL
jgi:hypothetical protein